MLSIVLSNKELFQYRGNRVRRMLALLTHNESPAYTWHGPRVQGGKVLVIHDGSRGGYALQKSSHRDYRFQTSSSQIECNYYELWRSSAGTEEWSLIQAYLTVFRVNRSLRDLETLLCIHCDPADQSEGPKHTYKVGPHLHIERADSPLPKCHFPLCINHFHDKHDPLESLTDSLTRAVEVVQHEVLPHYA